MAKESAYSAKNVVAFINENFGIMFISLLFFIGGFFIGSLWTENQLLKSGGVKTNVAADAGTAPQPAAPSGPTKEQLASAPKVGGDDHIKGNKNAKITLIEYSDFECPFCQRFHPTTQQVLEEFGDDVALVYRHYPLSFHPNAQAAAETSECVAKIGGNDAFWKYADAVFAENGKLGGKLTPAAIDTAVAAAGVNTSAVKTCVESGEMTAKVNEQMQAGGTAGISGTPGTILVTKDGEYEFISGAVPFEQLKTSIEKYL
jgi:protein-disulfide isomerase